MLSKETTRKSSFTGSIMAGHGPGQAEGVLLDNS